ncbi:MAG: diacylglycerol kinase family protein [Chloroflexota bacterium]
MPRRVKLILNPMADLGKAWAIASSLRPLLAELGGADWSGTVYPTHATELARQAGEEGYDLVIAIGGDGTVHEVVNGLMQVPESKRPLLGVVPVGSGNDFANAIGIPMDPGQALTRAMTGDPKAIDLGLIRDEHGRVEYFDNTIGIGFDAIVTIRSRKVPIFRGLMIYLISVIQTVILNYVTPKIAIETESEQWEDRLLMLCLCNGPREGGGFMVAPQARNDDGLFDYTSIRKTNRAMMFRLIPEVMKGTHGRFRQVRMGTFRKMTLRADEPLFIHTDGEMYSSFGSKVTGFTVEILPNALKIIA